MRKNPFQEAGQVIGEGYIGRHEKKDEIMDVFRKNSRDSSIIISGVTRMGKTSLVKNCIAMAKEQNLLEKNRIITVSLTLSTIKDFSSFLKDMMKQTHSALKRNGYLDDELTDLFEDMKNANKEQEDRIYEQDSCIREIFMYLNDLDIKTVILLDEFDSAEEMFQYPGEDISTNFQKFREYASSADYNVTFIVTSRKSIGKIDNSLPAGSNLRGVFTAKVLIGFTDAEREEAFEKIKESGVDLNEAQKNEVIWYAGRSPFLFSKLAHGILNTEEHIPAEEISIRDIFLSYKKDFDDYFDSLIDFMKREELYSKIVQLFFGPVYDLTDVDLERLNDAGYIYHDAEEKGFKDASYIHSYDAEPEDDEIFTYQTLSEYFVEYMRVRVNMDDSLQIWSELVNAEKELRIIVQQGLEKQFGIANWMDELKNVANSKDVGYLYDVNKAEAFISNSKRDFGDLVEDNPLTVISIRSLGNIIKAFWNVRYNEVFTPPYNELQGLLDELEQLNRARNPMAHVCFEYLSAADKENVTKYCNKIMNVRKNGRHR